ncbi:uncharacterized protein LOC131613779 [Vicia villosa]|uniref:uncharacterized protein LOC131613779 n=1 Tax=Vicia villosa TaxID=3911 RepID=UPI00273B0EE7|nr:uncharacterized protein LOC131613779 [Vicia villosa]
MESLHMLECILLSISNNELLSDRNPCFSIIQLLQLSLRKSLLQLRVLCLASEGSVIVPWPFTNNSGIISKLDSLAGADEYHAYNDGEENDGEEEERQLVQERKNQQQSLKQGTNANNARKFNGGTYGVSNSENMCGSTFDPFPHSSEPVANNSTSIPSSEGSHDRRKIIFVEAVSNPRRFVPQNVTRDIISRVITRMPIPAEKWKNYPIEAKDELFKDFMDKYKFTSDYDRNMARTVWERTCLDRYPDHLKNARKIALREVNSTNLVDTKGHGPKGMKAEVWDGLVDIWLKPEWKKKSDANRCNKAALPDAVLHTGGSINLGEHKKRMEEELKHTVSFRDVYARVHKKKDGEYVSQRSKLFVESYDMAILEKYGEDSSTHPMIDPKVWVKVSGQKKTRHTFMDRSLDVRRTMSAPFVDVTSHSRTMEEDIKKAVDKAMTSFVQTQLAPMLEPILSLIRSMPKAPMQSEVPEKTHGDTR